MTDRLYGLEEFAQAAGVRKPTLAAYLARGQCGLPEPAHRLACGPIWTEEQVTAWIASRHERKHSEETALRAREAKLAGWYDKKIDALCEAYPLKDWAGETARRNWERQRPKNRHNRIATVKELRRSHVENLVLETMRANPDQLADLRAVLEELDELRDKLTAIEERRGGIFAGI